MALLPPRPLRVPSRCSNLRVNLRRFTQPMFTCESVSAGGVVMGALAMAPKDLVRREWVALDDYQSVLSKPAIYQSALSKSAANQSTLSKPAVDLSTMSKSGVTSTPTAVVEWPDDVVLRRVEEGGNGEWGRLVIVLKNSLPPKVR